MTEHEILWRPAAPERTRIAAFRRALVAAGEDLGEGYAELHAWSLAHPGSFWHRVLNTQPRQTSSFELVIRTFKEQW